MSKRGRPTMPGIFTPREWQVLFMLRHGLTNQEIADGLSVTLAGAKFHVSEILSRLGMSSRREAANWHESNTPINEEREMTFQRVVPMLRTVDFPATIEFYRKRLGFDVEAQSEEYGWASLVRDSVRLMVSKPNQHLPFQAPCFTGSLYFYVDDVSRLWRAYKDTQEICYPMEDFDYGMREFAIYDNNGYILQFGAPLP